MDREHLLDYKQILVYDEKLQLGRQQGVVYLNYVLVRMSLSVGIVEIYIPHTVTDTQTDTQELYSLFLPDTMSHRAVCVFLHTDNVPIATFCRMTKK